MSAPSPAPVADAAVLCGSGISSPSGLPTGAELLGLLDQVLPREGATVAQALFESHGLPSDDRPWLRFEGILGALQKFADPQLEVLRVLEGGTPARAHDVLALLAQRCPVVTTNFDCLIERAAQSRGLPLPVRYREADFEIGAARPAGLWKIHGTIGVFAGTQIQRLEQSDGAPVATLETISATRESHRRRALLEALVATHPLIVIGYSGVDDFDICRWLRRAPNPRRLIWLQYRNADAPDQIVAGPNVHLCELLDPGPRHLARAWARRDLADRMEVHLTATPTSALISQVGPQIGTSALKLDPVALSRAKYQLPELSEWQKHMSTASLLVQISRYRDSLFHFRTARELSQDHRERVLARLEWAEAAIEVGEDALRRDALEEARTAVAESAGCPDAEYLCLKGEILIGNAERYLIRNKSHEVGVRLAKRFPACLESPSTRRLAPDLAMVLTQLRRHTQDALSHEISDARDVIAAGLLPVKAMALHEQAVDRYRLARTPEDVRAAMEIMEDAVELRSDLGHVRGLCASRTVLSEMFERLGRWPGRAIEPSWLERGRDSNQKVVELTREFSLPWDAAQALINGAILDLRDGRLAAAQGRVQALRETPAPYDAVTEMHVALCEILLSFAAAPSLHQACGIAGPAFQRVVDSSDPADPRLQRLRLTASFNAEACEAWAAGRSIQLPQAERDKLVTRHGSISGGSELNGYWEARVSEAMALRPGTPLEGTRLLLDPLAP